jgi:16S rRNA (guanine(966)-N(2))-methyltransferase RsmD
MPVKIIAGEFRGRNINCPEGWDVRPTSSMARAAIFNILQQGGACRRALDLYAGSGALGIEALSRGAESVVLVEKDPGPAGAIKDNLAALKLSPRARLYAGDALEFLRTCGEQFDLILADPPYPDHCLPDILDAVERSRTLADYGTLVIQHSLKEKSPASFGGLKRWKNKIYGKTQVSFYRNYSATCDQQVKL